MHPLERAYWTSSATKDFVDDDVSPHAELSFAWKADSETTCDVVMDDGEEKTEPCHFAKDNPVFCRNCQVILSRYVRLQSVVPEQSSEQNVVQLDQIATNMACRFCVLRRNLLTDEEFQSLDPDKPITFGYTCLIWACREDYQLALGFPLRDEPGQLVKQLRMVSEETMKSSHEETWRLAQGVSNLDMCSPVDWSRVDAWIEACEVGHGLCQRLISNTRQAGDPKPARIIYLGRGPKDTITARLQDTRDFALMPAYATMSHCWGTDMPTKLTQNVYELFHEQLPLQSIPTKFVQAMHVTKKLGLQYLWIDVLCIVQDDDSECLNEVAQMHHIYQHAQFNIAAANSSSWEYPLWSDSSRLRTDVVVVYPGWTNMEMYCVDEGLWHNNIGQSPLLKRGWVLQEISLAPRNLYFGKSQMFWECASLQASETWPSGLPKAVNTNKGKLAMATEIQLQLDPQKQSGRRSPRTSNGDRKKPSFLHLWPEVIKRYTSAELSRPDKDKLAALSGLANFVHDPMFYLAGLWIPQLPYTLAWCALSPTDPPTAYQAPSWSWAAINGNVRLPPLCLWDYKQTATLIDHRIERSGSSRTGRVLGGRIIIKSRMARGLIEHAWTESAPINSSTPTAVQAIELGPVVIHICPDRSGTIENRELYFLEIDSLRGLDRVIGIVLERNFFIKAGYYRVGYFQVARVIDIEGLQEQKYGRVEPNSIAFQHLCHDFWNSAVPTEYIGRLSGWMEVSIT